MVMNINQLDVYGVLKGGALRIPSVMFGLLFKMIRLRPLVRKPQPHTTCNYVPFIALPCTMVSAFVSVCLNEVDEVTYKHTSFVDPQF